VKKYASIDIGSNTLLLLITQASGATLSAVVDECDFGRLGQGLAHTGRLDPESVRRSLKVVRRYREIMDEHELEGVACVGTQALREASNREDFATPAQEILGCPIEIIKGDREAQLVSTAILRDFPARCQGEVLCVDVGGASTEFIHLRAGELAHVKSIPIGAVRLSESFLHADPASGDEIRTLYEAIDKALEQIDLPPKAQIIGSAGTATSIASISLKLEKYQAKRIHGLSLPQGEVRTIASALLSMSVAQKRALPGLEPKRADIVAAGVAIYDRVLRAAHAKALTVSDRGVRWGLAYELADR